MTRVMNQLSIDAYFSKVQPKLTAREKWVLEAIEVLGDASAESVANYYKVGVNIVSGRFTGLKNKGMIVKSRKDFNSLGNEVQYYKPAGSYEPMERDC